MPPNRNRSSKRRERAFTLVRLAAGAALGIVGCESVIDFDFDAVKRSSKKTDAGVLACESARPPPAPNLIGGGGNTEIVVVMHQIDFGDRTDAAGQPGFLTIGFDIDQSCTNTPDPPLCTPPTWTSGDPTDGRNGRDNGVGRILAAQVAAFGTAPIGSDILNAGVKKGTIAPFTLLRIRSYNGFAEDDQVEVEMFVPIAPNRLPGGGFVPKLDGSDSWPLAADFVIASDAGTGGISDAGQAEDAALDGAEPTPGLSSVFKDSRAYVTRGDLVAHFKEARAPFSNVYFRLFEVVLEAHLARNNVSEPWRVENGIMAGFGDIGSLLGLVPLVTSEILGSALCTDNPNYNDVKRFMCQALDIRDPGAKSNPGECNAASFGIAFETLPATFGSILPLNQSPLCPDATNPEHDDCTTPPPAR